MSYESANFINQLDINLPRATDTISEGDVHLRIIKDVLKQSFPNVDTAVNAIHTGSSEPVLYSTGSVWFDTSSGLIKMRNIDDTEWMVMAHGDSTGLGNLIRVYMLDWYDKKSWRDDTWIKITQWRIIPETTGSTIYFDASGEVSVWGNTVRNSNSLKFMDDTAQVDLGVSKKVIGFNHIDDSNNFEVEGSFNMKVSKANHGGNPFDLALYGKNENEDDGGCICSNVTIVANEYE